VKSLDLTVDRSGHDVSALPAPVAEGAVMRAGLALSGLMFLALFGPALLGLVQDWVREDDYRHGFLLLPVAAYLAWKSWKPNIQRRSPALGALTIVGAVLLFWMSTVAAEFFTMRFSALLALCGLVIYFLGPAQMRAWWLPVALLAFTIPLPAVVLNSLTLPLQLLASQVAVEMLQFRFVPATVAGNIIHLPGHDLFVAEACSGLRSLSALFGMTLLIGGTGLTRATSRIALLLLAIPCALAANALRVFVTGYLVYYFGPEAAEGALHESAGIIVFLVSLAAITLSMTILRHAERPRRAPDATA
jgi:exosortase